MPKYRPGERVGALIYDKGTVLTPAVVLGPDAERPDRVRVLVKRSTGFAVETFITDTRDYLDYPLPETAQGWEGEYAELEAEAPKHR